MIRFIDLRYQGTQHRFAFWDTVMDEFITIAKCQAWEDWEELEMDIRIAHGSGTHGEYTNRLAALCPQWVHQPATDEELEFKEEEQGTVGPITNPWGSSTYPAEAVRQQAWLMGHIAGLVDGLGGQAQAEQWLIQNGYSCSLFVAEFRHSANRQSKQGDGQ